MGIWLQQSDLANVMSAATFAAIFNDPATGVTNADIVASTIERAEQEVLSWLIDEYGTGIESDATLAADLFLKGCALEFSIAFAYDRYPEYVRANGKESVDRFARAEERMTRVLQSRQRPTSLDKKPANVGGFNIGGGTSIITNGPNGQDNGGDY